MIRSFAFTTQGRLHSENIDLFLMPTLLADTNLFLWVDLEDPTAEQTRAVLEDVFHFHPLSIEDCVMVTPSPKVEEYHPKEDDLFSPYLFLVMHAVDYSRRDGVNFSNMPELDWRYSYYVAGGLTSAATLGTYLFFKKRGWLK